MHRFYADDSGITNGLARLTAEDARHACRVLRMKVSEACEVFVGEGRYAATIASLTETEAICNIVSPLPSTEARLRITLYQGLPKADKMEWIIQKAVELGAEAVVPVAMGRCVVQLTPKDAEKKLERWRKIAREACKQSGRCRPMTVSAPLATKALPERLAAHDAAIVPWEDAKEPGLRGFHASHGAASSIGIVIGPEGGMSPEEVAMLQDAGCTPVTLGPRILRTETAGLSAISALLCLYGDME